MINGFQTSSCLCLLRRLFHPVRHLYLFTSAMLSFCHFNIKEKECWLSSSKTTNCHYYYTSLHRRWVAIEFFFCFSKHFLVMLGRSFLYHNTKQQTSFWGKSFFIKIGRNRNIFTICEIQVSLERAVNNTIALAIQDKEKSEHYSCEWLCNSYAS